MKRVFATFFLAALFSSCSTGSSWRSHRTSEVNENQREILARVRVQQNKIELNDCTVCFGPRRTLSESCAKLDTSGLVHQTAIRNYAWLKELECRLEEGKVIRLEFSFPYYAAETSYTNTAHYLGELFIELEEGGGTKVIIIDQLENMLGELSRRGKPPLKLKIRRSLLNKQDTTWAEEQNTPEEK